MVKRVCGEVAVPGDKSISHRYAILGAIAEGRTAVENFSASRDCQSTLTCLQNLGVPIETEGNRVFIEGVGLDGLREPVTTLDAENSGTTIRILSGVLAGTKFVTTITGDTSLQKRPMRRIIEPLTKMGATIEARDGNYPPLRIAGKKLTPIDYRLPVASAQVKSCVLMAGLYADGETVVCEPTKTRDHTEIALRQFGAEVAVQDDRVSVKGRPLLRGVDAYVPGDLSSSAFFIVAALLLPGSELVIKNVTLNPTRLGIVRLLQSLGARITLAPDSETRSEPKGHIAVKYSDALFDAPRLEIHGAMVPDLIDEIPILCVLGTQLKNGLALRDAQELRVKESDRIRAMAENLRQIGADVQERPDGMVIAGGRKLTGGEVSSYGDHRIAMTFAVANLIAGGTITIADKECVNVSFPGFFQALDRVCEPT